MDQKIEKLAVNLKKIPYDSLQVGELLGHGGYGDVYKAQWHGTEVALKQLHLKTLSPTLEQEFLHEAQVMAQCQFPHIINLYGICDEVGHNGLVMEYMARGSLRGVLEDKNKEISWEIRWNIGIDIGKGLTYLHSNDILHRNLKSLNVLLGADYHAKICDFGLSKIKLESSSSSTKSKAGTVRWRAPETFKRGFKPVSSMDIYSYGMVLWEIASRKIPFADAQDEITVMGWIKEGEKETIPTDCPKAYEEIVQACWQEAEKRPDAQEIVTSLTKAKPAPSPIILTLPTPEKQQKPYVEKSWHFDPMTERKVSSEDPSPYQLLEATDKDKKKVVGFYQNCPVAGYEIGRVQVIYNRDFNQGFEIQLKKLQHRDKNPAFTPKWESENHPQWRKETHKKFEDLARPHTDSDYPAVKLLPLWHGTKSEILPSLFSAGYVNLATTDSGFFGKGLYGAHEAEYPYRVYAKGAFILNWVAIFSAYPVIDGDMNKLTSKGSYQNYDAHFVPVVPQNPNNPNEVNYFPCKLNQKNQYTEVVVFESSSCLPRYLVELQATLVKSIQNPIEKWVIPGEEEYKLGNKFFRENQYLKSLPYFEKAAEKGYPSAYLRLARIYREGDMRVPKDKIKSDVWYQKVASEINWFREQAEKGDADVQCNLGICYEQGRGVTQDEKIAVKYYQLAADQGYLYAQYLLGTCYEQGEGVAQDDKQAVKYYKLAADQGDANAQWSLGFYYDNGEGVVQDYNQAVKYYQLAADQGNSYAQYGLGLCYENSQGVSQDYKQAVRYYQLAADQGYANAQWSLGLCYEDGRGVEQDYNQAVKYYQLAADQGLLPAQYNLGVCYEDGQGVSQDYNQAVKYYQLAADQGDLYAQYSLGLCYKNGQGVAQDDKQGVKYYQLAADQGLSAAQYNLGNCYYNGQGVSQDYNQAVKYYQLATDQGDSDAQYRLGCCYKNGQGVAQDYKQAVKYYQLVADQGSLGAQYNLGNCYYNGQGGVQDYKQAVKYYQLAADQGLSAAQYNLGNCYYNGQGVSQDCKQAVKYYQLAADKGDTRAKSIVDALFLKHPELKTHGQNPSILFPQPRDQDQQNQIEKNNPQDIPQKENCLVM